MTNFCVPKARRRAGRVVDFKGLYNLDPGLHWKQLDCFPMGKRTEALLHLFIGIFFSPFVRLHKQTASCQLRLVS